MTDHSGAGWSEVRWPTVTYVEEPEGAVPGLSAGARKLAARCEPQVNELARRMARGAFENLGGYAELPADVKDVEIAATARHAMRLFLRSAVRGPRPSDDGLETFQTRAAQRAEEGMPLQLLLRTYCMGTRELWRELRTLSEPGEEGALVELGDALFAVQDRVVGAVTESYLDEQSALAAEQRERRRSLAQALLDGTAHPERSLADGPALVVFMHLGGGSGDPAGVRPSPYGGWCGAFRPRWTGLSAPRRSPCSTAPADTPSPPGAPRYRINSPSCCARSRDRTPGWARAR